MKKTALPLPLLAAASALRAQEPPRIVDYDPTGRSDVPGRQIAVEGPTGIDFRDVDPIAHVSGDRARIDTLLDPAESWLGRDNRRRIERRPNA